LWSSPPSVSDFPSTAQDSIQRALRDVADKLHHIHLPHLQVHPGDWFKRKHQDLNAMTTPAGSNTAPVGSIINLLNGTLGAGILAMPLMFSLMGWLLATIVLCVTCACGIVTTTLMTYVGSYEQTESYHMTIHHTLGKRFVTLYEGLLIAGGLGGLMTYLILIGDFATAALSHLLVTAGAHTVNRRITIVILSLFAVLPLALLRKVKSLWFTGFMAMTFVVFYVLSMVYESSVHSPSPAVVHSFNTNLPNFFRALPLSFYAFACHNSVFPVYHEMRLKSPQVFRNVSIANHVITLVLYFASGWESRVFKVSLSPSFG
jgi:amino acid permease